MQLFHNGAIHTIEPRYPAPEVVLVGDDGCIAAIGTLGGA